MAGRTVFVNPGTFRNPRRRRRAKHRNVQMAPNPRRRRRRRNAGITPFVQNPLIMSNPPKRRRRRPNPLSSLNFNNLIGKSLTFGGGAAISVAANALLLNKIENPWARNGMRIVSAVVGGAMLRGELGAATAGSMFYPVIQELAGFLLGTDKTFGSGTEADIDAMSADLEDIMDELDSSDLQDDEETGSDEDIGDDGDILFG